MENIYFTEEEKIFLNELKNLEKNILIDRIKNMKCEYEELEELREEVIEKLNKLSSIEIQEILMKHL